MEAPRSAKASVAGEVLKGELDVGRILSGDPLDILRWTFSVHQPLFRGCPIEKRMAMWAAKRKSSMYGQSTPEVGCKVVALQRRLGFQEQIQVQPLLWFLTNALRK